MGEIEKAVHESSDALHLNRFSVTPVNDWWVITERTTPNDVQYLTKRDTQQEAINEVLQRLGYGDGEENPVFCFECPSSFENSEALRNHNLDRHKKYDGPGD